MDLDAISRMRAVTVSREYGSGGGEVAARLAERLGWQLIDHNVVARIAGDLGVSEEEAASLDERAESLISRILSSVQGMEYSLVVSPPPRTRSYIELYNDALRHVVKAASDSGHVVIVGRGSQVLLQDYPDVLHARVIAAYEKRLQYVMQREELSPDAARRRIHVKDRDRARFLMTQYHCDPSDPHLYDLVVNTTVLELDAAVDVIALALERKARKLGAPEQEVGPAVGMEPYPGEPADLKPKGEEPGSAD